MSQTFVHGYDLAPTFTPNGASSVTLNVTDHSWKEAVDAMDVTDTGASGVQALLAGILRGDGSMKGFLDSTLPFWDATRAIRAGTIGVLSHPVSSGKNYSVPCLIKEVNSVVAVNGAVQFDVSISLNSLAGSYSRPS